MKETIVVGYGQQPQLLLDHLLSLKFINLNIT